MDVEHCNLEAIIMHDMLSNSGKSIPKPGILQGQGDCGTLLFTWTDITIEDRDIIPN